MVIWLQGVGNLWVEGWGIWGTYLSFSGVSKRLFEVVIWLQGVGNLRVLLHAFVHSISQLALPTCGIDEIHLNINICKISTCNFCSDNDKYEYEE